MNNVHSNSLSIEINNLKMPLPLPECGLSIYPAMRWTSHLQQLKHVPKLASQITQVLQIHSHWFSGILDSILDSQEIRKLHECFVLVQMMHLCYLVPGVLYCSNILCLFKASTKTNINILLSFLLHRKSILQLLNMKHVQHVTFYHIIYYFNAFLNS